MISATRLVLFTRWGRFLLGAVVLFCAVLVVVGQVAGSSVKTKTGTLASLTKIVDANTGAYKYSELKLTGDNTVYRIDRAAFNPPLSSEQFFLNGTVDIWYTQAPLNDPNIIAVQLRDQSDQNPVKYATDAYTHPEHSATSNFILAGVLVVVALILGALGLFAPTAARKKAPARVPSR